MNEEYITVSQLNKKILKHLKNKEFKSILVKGEISGFTIVNKNAYFDLKDEKTKISCVMFDFYLNRLKFKPKKGMKVIVKGNVEIYEKSGKLQFILHSMTEFGVGDLHIAYEQLKEELAKEGLFNKEFKKDIPKFPNRIGVVTSTEGAAIKDIISTINRKWPLCEIFIFPSKVQGTNAEYSISNAIKKADDFNLDILIVGRGGGSFEDLNAYNKEIVARSVFKCETPVISAVGHERDHTIIDEVADIRAETPTAAADIAVPDFTKIINQLINYKRRANLIIKQVYTSKSEKLDKIKNTNSLKNPYQNIINNTYVLNDLKSRLELNSKDIIQINQNKLLELNGKLNSYNPLNTLKIKTNEFYKLKNELKLLSEKYIQNKEYDLNKFKNKDVLTKPENLIEDEKLLKIINKLEILNPLRTLKRGYTLTKNENGKVITSIKDTKKGDKVTIQFNDGAINSKII